MPKVGWWSWDGRRDLNLACRTRHTLPLKCIQKITQAFGPASDEIDVLQFSDTKHLLELLKAERNDKTRVFQFLHQVFRYVDFLLNASLIQG
jgi:hypothetical protein